MQFKLILGNRTYSSWSLRAWMLFRAFEIPFEYEVAPLYTAEFDKFREDSFPARTVPTLVVSNNAESTIVWDSLSITEWAQEQYPEIGIWPIEPIQRAAARSLCAEMHSGFNALRSTMPMNLHRQYKTFIPDSDTVADIARIELLWSWARSRWAGDGPYLFGSAFTAADAFFTPVAARFRTYSILLTDASRQYVETLLAHPAAVEFYQAAQSEPWVMEHNEFED